LPGRSSASELACEVKRHPDAQKDSKDRNIHIAPWMLAAAEIEIAMEFVKIRIQMKVVDWHLEL
jgi:hypothetical protein